MAADAAASAFSQIDKQALKQELRDRDGGKIRQRLEQATVNAAGDGTGSMRLLQTFLILQSSDGWGHHREALNPVMRDVLLENSQRFPDPLSRGRREQGSELVLMGKLYEKYLNDEALARDCYLKVIKRFLGRRLPQTPEGWQEAFRDAEDAGGLNADERYAFKRVVRMYRMEGIILNRIVSALDRKIMEAESAGNPDPGGAVEDPGESIPIEELRRIHMGEGGRP